MESNLTLFLISRSLPKFQSPFLSFCELTFKNSISRKMRDNKGIEQTVRGTLFKCLRYAEKLLSCDMRSSKSASEFCARDDTWSQVRRKRRTEPLLKPVMKAYNMLKLKSCFNCFAMSISLSIFAARCFGDSSRKISEVTHEDTVFQWVIHWSKCCTNKWYLGSSETD